MLPNPFTPTRVANKPAEFFGRDDILAAFPQKLRSGSVVIDGPSGIGKSSLLSQAILKIDGSEGKRPTATVFTLTCDSTLSTPEALAIRFLEQISRPEVVTKTKFLLPKIVEWEKTKSQQKTGPLKIVVDTLCGVAKTDERLVVVAIDESEKCPAAIARFVRFILNETELQQRGLDRIRFIVSGVSPFYETMVATDVGVARFFYERHSLRPFATGDAIVFLEERMAQVLESREAREQSLTLGAGICELLARVTGGHPHLLNLLGSYMLDHEESDPDAVLDARDLVGCFRTVCYGPRGPVYQQILNDMALAGHLGALTDLLSSDMSKCPTLIPLATAQEHAEDDSLKYFVQAGILSFEPTRMYRLNDEFLRIRIIMDMPDGEGEAIEKALLNEDDDGDDFPDHDGW